MKEQRLMNKRERKIMDLLWSAQASMTVIQIEEAFSEEHLTRATVFKAVQSLMDKGYVQIGGVERNQKSYARKVEPAISREEYAAIMLSEEGIDHSSLGNVVFAMLGNSKKQSKKNKEQVIKEVERIISEIRQKGE